MIEVCANCRFWERFNEYIGSCRRFPPSFPDDLQVAQFTDYAGKVCYRDRWPRTAQGSWCGEFQPTPEPAEQEGQA